MADMFGAPEGFSQLTRDQAIEAQSAAATLKALSEAEMLPTEKRLKGAHADYFAAQADAQRAATEEQKAIAELSRGIDQGSEGDPALMLNNLGTRLIQAGRGKLGGELAGKAQDILRGRAQTDAADAVATLRNARERAARLEEGARLAQSVNDPQSYDQARLVLMNRGDDVSFLPQTYEEFAKPGGWKDRLMSQGMSVAENLRRQAEKATQERLDRRAKTQDRLDNARIGVLGAREKLLQDKVRDLVKNGGNTDEVSKLRRERRIASEQRRNLELAKRYPPAPADPKMRDPGKVYRSPTGQFGMWNGSGWVLVPSPLKAATEASGGGDEADDEGEE